MPSSAWFGGKALVPLKDGHIKARQAGHLDVEKQPEALLINAAGMTSDIADRSPPT